MPGKGGLVGRLVSVVVLLAVLGLGVLLGSTRAAWPVAAAAPRMAEAVPAAVAAQPGAAQASRNVTWEQARRMLDAAAAYAAERNYSMSFVILDAGGHMVAASRMEGAHFLTPEFARGKAYGPAATGRSSASLNESYQGNPALWGNAASLGSGAPLLPATGTLPIFLNGVLIGSMGASGGPSQEDENAVRAGIQAGGLQASAN
jgi:uncharacterized protein GlcG (DUF336 family)